jgi:hypothetical protein
MRTKTLRALLLATTLGLSTVTATVVTAPAVHAEEPSGGEVSGTVGESPLPPLPLPPLNVMTISECGGTAPLTTSCTGYGIFQWGVFNFSVGCWSTLAYSGYINVSLTSSTASVTFTCYFAGGKFVSNSTPQWNGRFVEGQPFTLQGTAIGTGGWVVRVTQ